MQALLSQCKEPTQVNAVESQPSPEALAPQIEESYFSTILKKCVHSDAFQSMSGAPNLSLLLNGVMFASMVNDIEANIEVSTN